MLRINFFHNYLSNNRVITGLDEKNILRILKNINEKLTNHKNLKKTLIIVDDSYDLFEHQDISKEIIKLLKNGNEANMYCLISVQTLEIIPSDVIRNKDLIISLD